jgi:hypothetical protein
MFFASRIGHVLRVAAFQGVGARLDALMEGTSKAPEGSVAGSVRGTPS